MRNSVLQIMAVGGALALALALLAGRRNRRNSAPGGTIESDTLEEIDAHIERQMERLNIPGAALAVVEGEEISHLRGFGRARPGGEAPTSQTPFIIGSLTKSITALAVMQLVEEGKVELDAPARRYLPWFRVANPQASARITVRHLLNQTSGLPQLSGLRPLTDFDDSPDAGERQARALSTLELARPVGSAWEYCNMNYNLLGLVVEPRQRRLAHLEPQIQRERVAGVCRGASRRRGVSPYAAPTRATDLSGLPPTYIAVGTLDVFLDEDIDYARRLTEAGVPTELHVYPGLFHGSDIFVATAASSVRFITDRDAALRRALHPEVSQLLG